jgi:hypothetical protein
MVRNAALLRFPSFLLLNFFGFNTDLCGHEGPESLSVVEAEALGRLWWHAVLYAGSAGGNCWQL